MKELTEKQKQKLMRDSVTWTLVEKFTEEMISKGVNLGELKKIVTFLVVMNSVNVLDDNEKDVLEYIDNVHKGMLDLHHLHFVDLKSFNHEKDNTSVES